MVFRTWHITAKFFASALAALALFTIIILAMFYAGVSSGYRELEADFQVSRYEIELRRDAARCAQLKLGAQISRCTERVIERSRENQRGEEDLLAQREMSRWAAFLLILTILQLPVSVAGLAALLRTIDQGKEAIHQARISAKTEQRAWLKFDLTARFGPFAPAGESPTFLFEAEIKNIGHTPALEVRTYIKLCFVDPRANFAQIATSLGVDTEQGEGTTLFPNDHYRRTLRARSDEEARAAAGSYPGQSGDIVESEDRSLVFLIFLVRYKTVYDEGVHQTAALYRLEPTTETTIGVNFLGHYGDTQLRLRRHEDGVSYID